MQLGKKDIGEPVVAGLTPETAKIFEQVSNLECIRDLYLCGGTAQSLQMLHRESEDLDFELIGIRKERPALDFAGITTELKSVFDNVKFDILGDDHFLAYVGNDKVKLSFFRPSNTVKCLNVGYEYNNIKAPTLQELLGMKVYTACIREEFRDYYDIYCLLYSGCSLKEAVSYASYFSRRSLHSKDMYSRLLSPQFYLHEFDYLRMNPKYNVSRDDIRQFIATVMEKEMSLSSKGKDIGIRR